MVFFWDSCCDTAGAPNTINALNLVCIEMMNQVQYVQFNPLADASQCYM